MKRVHWLGLCIPVAVFAAAGAAFSGSPPRHAAARSLAPAESKVIVILRDQVAGAPPARHAMAARAAAIASAQAPLIAGLEQSRQRDIRSFSLINAFATSVSLAEKSRLMADPAVRAVVPDLVIHAVRSWRTAVRGAAGGGASPMAGAKAIDASKLCNTLEPQALQLTNAAFPDGSVPQAQNIVDANGQYVRGKGVKVAFLADGLDTTLPGFIHKDGTPVFVDYQDFSGDPAGTPTDGGEAFGDASSIAAQDKPDGSPLTFDISQFVNQAVTLPSPCNIRIRGIAPNASLVGLKVFSEDVTTTSNFVQAIDYAVATDDVDVINESFGGNPFPDNANDPISLADEAAVSAGVTVVVSTGDAGSAGTLGSPATSTAVIAAGASTQFRFYAQTGYYAMPLASGYISDNISSLSSGGFAQYQPRTVDIVAPGDLSWALCSTNTGLYNDCTNFQTPAAATPIESFGGTSEAAPLVSGEAALIIQAYRSTHGGANPTPAEVKQIILSTATDLGAPAEEQGAGLINTLDAVKAALSIRDANGTPAPRGSSLLLSSNAVNITDPPGTAEKQKFVVTNAGATTRHLNPVLQTLTDTVGGGTFNLQLDPSTDATFTGPLGEKRAYVTQTFAVPANAQHLDAAIAYQSPIGSEILARLVLLDPAGREAAYTLPQGDSSGYGHIDVVKPAPGTWTAVVFTVASSAGYSGPVQLTWTAERRVAFGTVSPSLIDLAPGQSATIVAKFDMPSDPGDRSASLRFREVAGDPKLDYPAIPVTMRTLVPLGGTGGVFAGTLTGGNARPDAGPTQTFAFDVPQGLNNMSLVLQIPDNGYLLEGLLVDPNGMQLSVEPNVDPFGDVQYALTTSHYNPQAGRWLFVLLQDFVSSGNQTSIPFSARVGFNTAAFSATGLPNDSTTTISASGGPVTVPIQIVNTGAITAAYFADARLAASATVSLPLAYSCPSTQLPYGYGCFNVPTQASAVQFSASSDAPIQMDAFNDVGYYIGFTEAPDIFATTTGTNAVAANLSEPEIPYGFWEAVPSLIGPYGSTGAQNQPLTMAAQATIQPFDTTVSADSGDIWADQTLGTNTFNPLVLAPGTGGTITLTIQPTASEIGSVVTGFIYLDTYNSIVETGDEVVQIPYSYTVTP